MNKTILILLIGCSLISCKEKIPLHFTERNIEFSDDAVIEINIPNADGTNSVAKSINSIIENFIVNTISFGEDSLINISLNDAAKKFDSMYVAFKDDFEESSLVWEVFIDGEVTYQSPEITCIAINSYLNTGGAHGNMNISFLNFNSQTGELLQNDDIIKNKDFIKLAEKYFNLELQEESNEDSFDDYFFGDDFHLPENIGFSDEGVILLYNVYEIAPYSEGITEFTIPFEEALPYLKIN